MRRSERALSREAALDILRAAEFGTLATVGADGEPYAVPLTFALSEDASAILFHCAVEGRKLDNLRAHPRAHFSAVLGTQVLPELYTIVYRCAMVEGPVEELQGAEKQRAACLIAAKYAPAQNAAAYAARTESKYRVFRLAVEAISGKGRSLPTSAEAAAIAADKV